MSNENISQLENESLTVSLYNNAVNTMRDTLLRDLEIENEKLTNENTELISEILETGDPLTSYVKLNEKVFDSVNESLTKTNYKFPSFVNMGNLINSRTQPSKIIKGESFFSKIPFIFPIQNASVGFIQSQKYKEEIIKTTEMLSFKLISSLPNGLVRTRIIDKNGAGQNMPNLIKLHNKFTDGKIITDEQDIEFEIERINQSIASITTSINLSGFENIEEYNRNTDEIPQPYQFLFIANFPTGFTRKSAESLISILDSGPKVGIYTIMTFNVDMKYGTSQPILGKPLNDFFNKMSIFDFSDKPHEYIHKKIIKNNIQVLSIPIAQEDEYRDMLNSMYKIEFEVPEKKTLEHYVERLNDKIKDINIRPIIDITKTIPKKLWTMDANLGISVPFGKAGIENIYFSIGIDEFGDIEGSHHVLIGGSTGSGKTVLLHDIILHSAMKFSPKHLKFWLLDYKEGTEFAVYKDFPHVEILSMESEIEFGQQVLEKAIEVMNQRGELFKEFGCSNLNCFNNKIEELKKEKEKPESEQDQEKIRLLGDKDIIPRIIILIDEFQALFPNGQPKVTAKTNLLIDQILRLGRSFGINLALSTQTLKGIDMDAQLMSNMPQRIGLKMDKKDVSKIFTENNYAVSTLSFPGEGIYNKQFGEPSSNIKFQAFLALEESVKKIQNIVLDKIEETYDEKTIHDLYDVRFVYSGDKPGDITKNINYGKKEGILYIGESAGLSKEHEYISLKKDFAENLLLLGQDMIKAGSIYKELIKQIKEENESAKIYLTNFNKKIHDVLINKTKNYSKIYDNLTAKEAIQEVYEEFKRRKEMDINDALKEDPIYFFNFFIDGSLILSSEGGRGNEEMNNIIEMINEASSYGIFIIIYSTTFQVLTKNGLSRMLDKFKTKIIFPGSGNVMKALGEEGYLIEQSKSPNVSILEKNETGQAIISKFKPYVDSDIESRMLED